MKASDLEKIGKEFLKSYKLKTEQILKDLRSSIQSSNGKVPNAQKDAKSSTKKDLTQRLVRILMLHFTTYIEIIKVGQFGTQS